MLQKTVSFHQPYSSSLRGTALSLALHLRLGACLQVPAGGWLGYLQLHLTLFAVGVATGCVGASFTSLWPFFLTTQIQSWEKGSQPGSVLPTFWRVPDLAVDIIWTKQLRGGCPDSFMQCAMLALVVSGNWCRSCWWSFWTETFKHCEDGLQADLWAWYCPVSYFHLCL